MTVYRYKAVADNGQLVRGEIEAPDANSAIKQLRAAGQLPISTHAKVSAFSTIEIGGRLRHWRDRIRSTDITAMTQELATLLEAGIPLDASLRTLERHTEQIRLKQIARDLRESVRSGESLSTGLTKHKDTFDSLYVNLVRAGEASGALDATLRRLAHHREQTERYRASLVSAVTYPAILTGVACLSLFVLMTFVIPRFIPLFADSDVPLPLLTQIVFATAEAFQLYWWIVPLALVAIFIVLTRFTSAPDHRARLDRWVLRVPALGELVRLTETVRFARTLGTLLHNDLPLLLALRLVKDVAKNIVFGEMIEQATSHVRAGARLAPILKNQSAWPTLATELILIGEESGQLDLMLSKAADALETRAQSKLKHLLTLLEPMLILGLGSLIALIIIAILMAMLSLNELIV